MPPLEDRGGNWGFILRAVWRAAGNFKQESDRIISGFGNTSQASGMEINCAVSEHEFPLGGVHVWTTKHSATRQGSNSPSPHGTRQQIVRTPTQTWGAHISLADYS